MTVRNLNIEILLQPINDTSPVGEDIEYEVIYDEIRQARESDPEYLTDGDWAITEPRSADWNKVRKLCEQVLRYQSKDLQIGCWYVEALTNIYGPEGLSVGCNFLSEFISRFWKNCWPSINEGKEMRYGKLLKLDKDIANCLIEYPVIKRKETTLSYWYKVLSFEHNLSINPDRRDEMIASEGDFSMKTFKSVTRDLSPTDISNNLFHLSAIPSRIDELESCYFFNSKDVIHDIFSKTRQCIKDLTEFLQRLVPSTVSEKQRKIDTPLIIEEPDIPLVFNTALQSDEYFTVKMTRDVAIEQMRAIAQFFRQSEPSSPVPYLIERAIRWTNMSVTDWLTELLPDKDLIQQINKVLKGED
ncbi:TPA: type VI secretion system protein TssA [Yersinia enterocolitica]|nr:type VI secretion system protein TssA [Yersinia enterocolitica]